ncbi:MAG: DNA-binding protein [Acidobacteria bacterium]|nr:DNA-binding protein [Acidobacteriota bacterium]
MSNEFTELLNEFEVAKALRVSIATVRRWRLLRQGPRYLKIGASVRYTSQALVMFLSTRPTGGGQEDR